jgi:hypothetical protein
MTATAWGVVAFRVDPVPPRSGCGNSPALKLDPKD